MLYLGIDIGSSSSKAAVVDDAAAIVATKVINLGTGTTGLTEALQGLYAENKLEPASIGYTVATGYGRMNCPQADRQITEITCHAKGIAHLVPGAGTVIDIGGQDAKVIRLSADGRVQNFMMNEKCAAGTGRFLEVMARVLGCPISELSGLAAQSTQDIAISSVCTVFAESEVISQLSQGARLCDVAKGAHRSVAKRVAGMCARVGIAEKVVMSGGVALNGGMVAVLAEELQLPVTAAPNPQAVGAIGAALLARSYGQK